MKYPDWYYFDDEWKYCQQLEMVLFFKGQEYWENIYKLVSNEN